MKRKRNAWQRIYGYSGQTAADRKKRYDYALAQHRLIDEQMYGRKR